MEMWLASGMEVDWMVEYLAEQRRLGCDAA
jgi:hypothetical protein